MLEQEKRSETPTFKASNYRISYLREIGLVCNKKCETFRDSPDGLCVISKDGNKTNEFFVPLRLNL